MLTVRIALVLGAVLAISPAPKPRRPLTVGMENQTVEVLQGTINPGNANSLVGLACRNYNQIVHLSIRIEWSATDTTVEATGYKRLVVWDDTDEFLFFDGSYKSADGVWVIDGYFIPLAGGTHQGVTSHAFERIDNPHRFNGAVREIEAKGPDCYWSLQAFKAL